MNKKLFYLKIIIIALSLVFIGGILEVQAITCNSCVCHADKKCVGNSVYWFDSCDNQQDLFQTCTTGQICQNAQCVNVVCSKNSDCGTDNYLDSPFCQSGSVYQNYKTYTCNNPGTANSSCSNSTAPKLKTTCGANQTCSSGACVNIEACTTNANCGTNGYVDSPICQSGKVYQNYKTYTCNNAGTTCSFCSNSTVLKLKQTCGTNQICSNGACTNITCSTNANCGTNGYVDSPICQSGNVYQNYKTYTCNNPGTASSSCSNSIVSQLKTTCGANQTCSNGTCTDINIVCSSNSQCGTNGYIGDPICQSGNVYQNYKTYTCNNPGTANSSCSNSTVSQLKITCGANQTCSDGICSQQNNLSVSCFATPNPVDSNKQVIFIATPSGGQIVYAYSWSGACSGHSQACYSSFSQLGTQTANITVTSGGQTASANCSVVVNQGCTSNHQQKCVGNSVYWFDSCGAQESLIQSCSYNQTCSNGSCTNNCTYHYSQRCINNNLYWFDSCGSQQGISQYCSDGCQNDACIIQQNISVQTNSVTNNYNNQATLNGYVYGINSNSTNYVWFQWGTSTLYGYETLHQTQSYSGTFNQNIANLSPGATYHFRAVAQNIYGSIVYGSDMTFTTGSTNQTGSLISVNKTAKNISSGNSNWSSSISASPADVLMFMITIQATGNQNINNVTIRDVFPANLIYKNQLVVSGSNNYTGDINSLMSLGTISAGQIITITYQAQIASSQYFSYGTTTLNNSVSINSSESNSNSTSNVAIVVKKTAILGATSISTGLTNNFLIDSFFLPLMIAIIGVWLFKSGAFGFFEKWIDIRKVQHAEYKTQKELKTKIIQIKEADRS